MRLLALFCLLLACGGCTRGVGPCNAGYRERIYHGETLTDIVYRYGLFLEKSKGLRLEHSYVCQSGGIDKIEMILSSQEILEICGMGVRRLIVDVAEGLLERLNSSPLARNHHGGFPFAVEELDIAINFESFYGIYVDPTYVGIATLKRGVVHYAAFGVKNPEQERWGCRTESYALAKEQVMIEREVEKPHLEALRKAREERRASVSKERYTPEDAFLPPPIMGHGY